MMGFAEYRAQKCPPISIIQSVYWSFSVGEERKGKFMPIILGWIKGPLSRQITMIASVN